MKTSHVETVGENVSPTDDGVEWME